MRRLLVILLLCRRCPLGRRIGCESAKCHVGIEPMHASPAVHLACVDCHGGRTDTTEKTAAHVAPRNPRVWQYGRQPGRAATRC